MARASFAHTHVSSFECVDEEGKYDDGELVLRAKIDMASPNIQYARSSTVSNQT